MSERYHYRFAIAFELYEPGPQGLCLGVTVDLGLGGLCLATQRDLPPRLTARLVHDKRSPGLLLPCCVVWRGAGKVGIAFDRLTPDVEVQLRHVVATAALAGCAPVSRHRRGRIAAHTPVHWLEQGNIAHGTLVNLSVEGALIASATIPAVGVALELILGSAEKDTRAEDIRTAATVVHRSEKAFGVEFVEPSVGFREVVNALILEFVEGQDDSSPDTL